jgi:hypothetical protein
MADRRHRWSATLGDDITRRNDETANLEGLHSLSRLRLTAGKARHDRANDLLVETVALLLGFQISRI